MTAWLRSSVTWLGGRSMRGVRIDPQLHGRVTPRIADALEARGLRIHRQLANLPAGSAYDERRALHRELVARVGSVRLSANASAELRCLVAAMRRVAAASFSNRWGRPYQERRQALLELRGCIDTWRRSEGR